MSLFDLADEGAVLLDLDPGTGAGQGASPVDARTELPVQQAMAKLTPARTWSFVVP